jgi:hypothetical protein
LLAAPLSVPSGVIFKIFCVSPVLMTATHGRAV